MISVSVGKFRMRSMSFSFASVLRKKYRDLFEDFFKPFHAFAQRPDSGFIPFLACHHSITDSEINDFLNQDSFRLLRFVSDLVSIFDTG